MAFLPVIAQGIIALALLRIFKDLMCLVYFFETLFGCRIILAHVRMTGACKFAVFLFYLFLARITLNAEDLVIIFIFQLPTP